MPCHRYSILARGHPSQTWQSAGIHNIHICRNNNDRDSLHDAKRPASHKHQQNTVRSRNSSRMWGNNTTKCIPTFRDEKQAEREAFFNTDLAYLLRKAPEKLLLGDDFNCVLDASDATGTCTYSRTLAALVQGYALRDVWTQPTTTRIYTHYSVIGETHIERFYVTPPPAGIIVGALYHKL